jgi:hypothetical protein
MLTEHPLWKTKRLLDTVGRLMQWSVELGEP